MKLTIVYYGTCYIAACSNHNAHFVPDCRPLAKWSFPLAERALLNGESEDVAYFEPFYLKDFIALKPKKLI